jgi:NAD(P)-dependent dehydrogenase (short-subunit alcohol dehydrogenase family)
LVTELRELGAEAEYIRADVRIEEDVHNLVDQTIKRFGRIDVAVNNAGTEGKPGPLKGLAVSSISLRRWVKGQRQGRPFTLRPNMP